MTSPAAVLAKALEPLAEERIVVGRRCGLLLGTVNRAAGKRPISADHLLRLCAVVGVDPVSGYAIEPRQTVGAFDHLALAMAIRMTMHTRKHSLRVAAATVDLPHTVFFRLKHGVPVTIEGTLAGCRYVGLHPLGYMKPVPVDVKRETPTGTDRSAA